MSAAQDEPFRWSLNKAAEEFGFARQTVKNRMIRAGISPGVDGMYSTKEVVAALYTDKDQAELRKATAEARIAEMECAEMEKQLLRVDVVTVVWQTEIGKWKDVISSLDMPKAARSKVMKALREIPLNEYSEDALSAGDEDSAPVA